MDANSHPIKVQEVKDAKFFANTHPYKVTVVGGGGGGTSDYEQLSNLPKINGTELKGDKATQDLFTAGEGITFDDATVGADFNIVATNYRVNEVESIAKGANQAIAYNDYQALVTAINAMDEDNLNPGQNLMVVTLNVPDLWVQSVETESIPYTYTTDAAIVNALETDGYIRVGYYKLSQLETQKVDLTNYVENTDYASSSKGGVIKPITVYATEVNGNGNLTATTKTYQQYTDGSVGMYIGKGTLENVITGKNIISTITLTQAEYDALTTYADNTNYQIIES